MGGFKLFGNNREDGLEWLHFRQWNGLNVYR